MKIDRSALLGSLEDFALAGNGVILGRPGVGKSYLLRQLNERLNGNHTPHVFIPLERLGTGQPEEVEDWLGAEPDAFFAKLMAEGGENRGIIVFDSFDAARSEEARGRFLNLFRRTLNQTAGRWSVVVSVRVYDAGRSRALAELFADPDRPGFPRQFVVPELSDKEIDEAVSQIDGLGALVAVAAPEFRELLRVPFNLWLAEQSLTAQDGLGDLSGVRSEVQLLDAYWIRRVSRATNAPERESVLGKLVSEMIRRRSISIPRSASYTPASADAWSSLLSVEVLREDTSADGVVTRVAFSHNILFDYAVSVLAIGENVDDFLGFITEDPSRPLFLQPSLSYYLARAWYRRASWFWRCARALEQSESLPVRVFARLVPPIVVANEAVSLGELDPLFHALAVESDFAVGFFLRVFQALRIATRARESVWASVAAKLARQIERPFAWELVTYVSAIVDRPDTRETVLADAGRVARSACEWFLRERVNEESPWLVALGANWIVPLVVKTGSTNRAESVRLLRRVLAITTEPGFSIQYPYQLCNQVESIADLDPVLAGQIYRTIFVKDEESREETRFGTPVLPFRSTRKQDFEMCRFVLAKSYRPFLERSFLVAAQSGIDAINAHVLRNRLAGEKKKRAVSFEYRGRKARFRSDFSYIWGDARYHEDALTLSDSLFGFVGERASANGSEVVEQFLDVLAKRADVAFIWRSLLELAARKPSEVASHIGDLLQAEVILTRPETVHEVGALLRVAGDSLSPEEWAGIERFIQALPGIARRRHKWRESVRKRLLVSFPSERLQSEELRGERKRLIEARVANEPLSSIGVTTGQYTHRDWLREEGVAVEASENEPLLRLRDELESLSGHWRNQSVSVETARDLLTAARHAVEEIEASPQAAPLVRVGVWTQLSGLLTAAALRASDVSEAEREKLRRDLLAAVHDDDLSDDDLPDASTTKEEPSFDVPAWSPTPITEAAPGIVYLAAATDYSDVLTKLRTLAGSNSKPVRYLVATELFRIRERHAKLFWEIVEERLSVEANRGIRDAIWRTLYRLPAKDGGTIARIAAQHFDLESNFSRTRKDSEVFATLLVWLGLRLRQPTAAELLENVVTNPATAPVLLRGVLDAGLRTITPEVLADPKRAYIAQGAGELVQKGLRASRVALATIASSANQTDSDDVTELYSIADDAANLLRFNISHGNKDETEDVEHIEEFYAIAKRLLDEVVQFGGGEGGGVIYAPTAHGLMELFNVLLPADPEGVLHLAAEVATGSERAGYNLDGMAVREVVKLVDELLADYRLDLQAPAAMADLLRLLDVFARVGWPEALQRILRLDEIFR